LPRRPRAKENIVPEVYALRFTRAEFDKLPEQQRLVHLMLGQLANDINLLQKQLIFAMNGFGVGSEPEHQVSVAQAMLAERLLAGRLNEAYEFIRTPECHRATREANLPDEWRAARKSLNTYFGADNLIRRLRNKLAFHFDVETIREAYETVPAAEPMVDYVTLHQGDCLWGSSDVLTSFAMISLTGEADTTLAVRKIAGELIRVAGLLLIYILHAQMSFVEKYFPEKTNQLTEAPTYVGGASLLEVRMPFYCSKPTPEQVTTPE
jgi:hypothetical protein